MDKVFDLSKISVIITTPSPVDITPGLVIDGDFFSVEKENKDEVTTRRGTRDESYSTNSIQDSSRIITLKYIPSAPAVSELDLLKKAGTRFGILFQNNSSPRYKGMASNCRIVEKPPLNVGVKGFGTSVWKILMADYIEIYLGSI
ncbi:hypothetical protein [Leptospira noguchii]|uniref:hypothetical protein n=1 Tax=Leptospira noguchii TaxID=28182 RepID=UPI001FB6BADB|nr:hypothetical protein [Leptospira noguchii]UOG40793.1 hypothetical protein MAL05_13120 [Leptospira noguchii]